MVPVTTDGQSGGEEACFGDYFISPVLAIGILSTQCANPYGQRECRGTSAPFSRASQGEEVFKERYVPPKMNRPAMAPPKFLTSPFIVMVIPQARPMTEIHVCGAMYIKQICEGTSNRPYGTKKMVEMRL